MGSQSAGPEPSAWSRPPGGFGGTFGGSASRVGAADGRGLTLKWPELLCRAVSLLSVRLSGRACSGSLSAGGRLSRPLAHSPGAGEEGRKEGCQGSGAGDQLLCTVLRTSGLGHRGPDVPCSGVPTAAGNALGVRQGRGERGRRGAPKIHLHHGASLFFKVALYSDHPRSHPHRRV